MSQSDEISSGSLLTLDVASFYISFSCFYFHSLIPKQCIFIAEKSTSIFKDKEVINYILAMQIFAKC